MSTTIGPLRSSPKTNKPRATLLPPRGSAKRDRRWKYRNSNGKLKILVEHPHGTAHIGIPKLPSTHATGGPPKYYDYGNFGHVGE